MHRYALANVSRRRGGMDSAVELPGGERVHRIQTGKEPPAGQDFALSMAHAPPRAQAFEQHRREHGVAVLAALALLHTQGHAFAVDVADLQRNHLAGAQTCTVGH